jgi:hypothetical protein
VAGSSGVVVVVAGLTVVDVVVAGANRVVVVLVGRVVVVVGARRAVVVVVEPWRGGRAPASGAATRLTTPMMAISAAAISPTRAAGSGWASRRCTMLSRCRDGGA